MFTGLEAEKVIFSSGDAAMRPRTPVNIGVATLNLASPGSLAQPRPTIDPPTISDVDMAWSLVDAVKSRLTGYDRTFVFVELGCGESYLMIRRILTTVLSTGMVLPVAILSKLAGWLNGYAGSPDEPQLRMMLAVIRLQHWKAV